MCAVDTKKNLYKRLIACLEQYTAEQVFKALDECEAEEDELLGEMCENALSTPPPGFEHVFDDNNNDTA